MGALKRDVTNLEEEKKSLISVIELLQVDAQQLGQKSRVIESKQKDDNSFTLVSTQTKIHKLILPLPSSLAC